MEVSQASPAEDFCSASGAIRFRNAGLIERAVDDVANRFAGRKVRDLVNQTEPRTLSNCDVACIGNGSATHDSKQRRFAGAVRTDNPDPRAVWHDERHILKKRCRAESFGET